MRLYTEWNRPARPPDGRSEHILLVRIETEGTGRQIPCDALILLDTSRSMEGERIERAREACALAFASLRPDDRAAVCTFASEGRLVLPMSAPSEVSADELRRRLARVPAAGVTRTVDALRAAARMLADRGADGRSASVVLITDGLPTSPGGTPLTAEEREELLSLAEGLGRGGVRLVPLGLGSADEYNVALLSALADRGRGSFCCAPTPEELTPRLVEQLARARSVAPGGAVLRAKPLAHSPTLLACARVAPEFAAIEAPDHDPDGAWEIRVGALSLDEPTDVLLRVAVEARFGAAPGAHEVLGLEVRTDLGDHAEAAAALVFATDLALLNEGSDDVSRLAMLWDVNAYQSELNSSPEASRAARLLDGIRQTGRLLEADQVVAYADSCLEELRATGQIRADGNARATDALRQTGRLLSPVDVGATERLPSLGLGFGGPAPARTESGDAP